MNELSSASAVLRMLHANADQNEYCLHILRKHPETGQPATDTIALADLDGGFDASISDNGGMHHYVTVGLVRPGVKTRRNKDIAVVTAIFIDVDLATDTKPARPRTLEEAEAFLRNDCPVPPTLVTFSGSGLHAFWRLKEPLAITDAASRDRASELIRGFASCIHAIAKQRHGWGLDHVADLARVHRIPYSMNAKAHVNAECVPLWHEDVSYDMAALEALAVAATGATSVAPALRPSAEKHSALDALEAAQKAWLKDGRKSGRLNAAGVMAGCGFLRHALENAATLSEPEWHAAINVLGRTEHGKDLAHDFSAGHPGYRREETEQKFAAAQSAPPVSCEHIHNSLGFAGCDACSFRGRLQQPHDLGLRSAPLVRLLEKQVYVANIGAFVDLAPVDADPLPPERFKRFHASPTLGGKADELVLNDGLATKAHRRDWRPDIAERLFLDGGQRVLNTYVPVIHTATPTPPDTFFDHVGYLLPDERERAVLLGYLAHLVQHPGEKITYAICLVGGQGGGKTYIADVMGRVLGSPNVRVTNGHRLKDAKFNRHMAAKVLLAMEEVSMDDKSKSYEALKAMVSNDRDEFEGKFLPTETLPTPRGVLALTNHTHALFLAEDDRRFFVVGCSGPHPDGASYYQRLYAQVGSPGFISGVHAALKDMDLSGFNSKYPPFVTKLKAEMISYSRSEIDVLVSEMLESERAPFDRELWTWDELREAIREESRDPSLTNKRMRKALACHGVVVDPQGRQCPVGGARSKLFMRNPDRYTNLTAAELGRRYSASRRPNRPEVFGVESPLALVANN
mgnify:CR=1 FL=1